MHVLIAIVLFDTIVHSNSTTMKFWRSRSFDNIGQELTCSLSVNIFKGFFIETTVPVSFKFHMQPSSKGGKKVYIFRSGHMTKMATMPIGGENLKKSSPPEPLG